MKYLKEQNGASVPAILGYIVAIALLLFGILNIYSLPAAPGGKIAGRIIIAVVSFIIGGGLLFLIPKWESQRPIKLEMSQKIDLSGNVATAKLKCKNCGADLEKKSVEVRAGAVFINCPYCGSAYQVTEEPQW